MKGLYLIFTFLISLFVTTFSQDQDPMSGITMDWEEKDKILSCVEIVSRKFQKDEVQITKLGESFNAPKEPFSNKLSAEMLSACYNRIDEKTVRGMFQNLTLIDADWHDSYEPLVSIDYTKFKPVAGQMNLDFTPDQQVLFYKLDKAREEYIRTNRERIQKAAQTISVFGFDLSQFSGEFKTFYILCVFALFIFGVIYFNFIFLKYQNYWEIFPFYI